MRKNIIVAGSILMVIAIMISAGFIFNDESPKDPKVSAVNWMTFEEAIEAQKTYRYYILFLLHGQKPHWRYQV